MLGGILVRRLQLRAKSLRSVDVATVLTTGKISLLRLIHRMGLECVRQGAEIGIVG
jgi:hypothetical protein